MSRPAHPEHLDAFDTLAGDERERERVLAHVRACAACRRRWLAADPARCFALLGGRAVPAAVLERVSAGVLEAIDSGRSVPPVAAPGRMWRAAGALAAGVVLGALIFTLADRRPALAPSRVAAAPAVEAHPSASVAVLESPGHARVVDLTVGQGQLVMIFDEELDL